MPTSVNTTVAEAVLKSVSRRRSLIAEYREYWERLRPKTHAEYMDRWVFAVCSIVNTWQNNVNSYRFIRNLGYPLSRCGAPWLVEKLRASGCGVHNRRAESFLSIERGGFWTDPDWWYPRVGEPLGEFRDRLAARVRGVGKAKVSFVIEMLLPESCEVLCCDRHVFRLYGLEQEREQVEAVYPLVEGHWTDACRRLGLPAPLARHIVWDQLRKPVEWSTRYWSHVLEDSSRAAEGYYDVVSSLKKRKPLVI